MKYWLILIGCVVAIPVYFFLNSIVKQQELNSHSYKNEPEHKIAHYWKEFSDQKPLAISYSNDGVWRGDTAFVLPYKRGLAFKFESKKDTIQFAQCKKWSSSTYQISINSMVQGAYKAFMHQMEVAAGKTGFDTLVLNLSQCTSGTISEAIKITNQLIFNKGVELVRFHYFNGNETKINSTGDIFFPVNHIIIQCSPRMCPEANLITDILKTHAAAKVDGKIDHNNERIYDLYPVDNQYFVFIPVGTYSVTKK